MAETQAPGVSVSSVARRHELNANQLFNWLRDPRFSVDHAPKLLAVDIASEATASDVAPAPSPCRIEIELPNGARLCCDAGIDPHALTRVIAALGRSA